MAKPLQWARRELCRIHPNCSEDPTRRILADEEHLLVKVGHFEEAAKRAARGRGRGKPTPVQTPVCACVCVCVCWGVGGDVVLRQFAHGRA